jgi:hypothetical protein
VGVVGRDAVVYPGVAAGATYLLAGILRVTVGTLLFALFAVAAVATGSGRWQGARRTTPCGRVPD